MKPTLLLLATALTLSACSTLPAAPAPVTPAPAAKTAPAASAPAKTAPAAPAAVAAPSAPVALPAAAPSHLEFTAVPTFRSGSGSQTTCAVVALPGKDLSIWLRATNCGLTGTVQVSLTLNGQTTTQLLGNQDVIVRQIDDASGLAVPVTASITSPHLF